MELTIILCLSAVCLIFLYSTVSLARCYIKLQKLFKRQSAIIDNYDAATEKLQIRINRSASQINNAKAEAHIARKTESRVLEENEKLRETIKRQDAIIQQSSVITTLQ